MAETELTKLRRARSRVHFQIAKMEPLLAGYHAKAEAIEAHIHVLAPELNLPPRRYKANPHFARGELPRLALRILREAGRPMATKEIALRCLAAKGVTQPDRRSLKLARIRLGQMFSDMQKKGLTVRVGSGNFSRRAMA